MNGTALRKPTVRRVVGMVAGIVIIALGIALFKQSHLGNDSISALNMRLAELLGISLGTQNLCTNILFFLLEFWFGRKYIGLGTFVNGICIGYIVTAFYDPIHAHFGDAPSLAVQLAWVIAAVLVTALGASLYQTADLGIAPYDYLSSSSSIGRSPRRCCNTNRTIEKPRGVKSYAAGVFFIAAVKQKMKMKEIYLSKPPVDCCGDGEP